MAKFKTFVEFNVFWMMAFLTILLASPYFQLQYSGTWNITRTIGWGRSIPNLFTWFPTILLIFPILFVAGYGIIFSTR